MIVVLAWATLLVFVVWCLFAGLPDYLHKVEEERAAREKKGNRRFAKMTNGHGKLNDDDLAELEGMFGETGTRRSDYE